MRLYLLFIFMIFITACGTDEKAEQAKLRDEVYAIHDEVMPEMGRINKFKRDAEVMANEYLNDSIASNDEMAMELENLVLELIDADESMMKWMRTLKNDFEGMTHEEIVAFWEGHKVEAKEVRQKINSSLEKANDLLKQEESAD